MSRPTTRDPDARRTTSARRSVVVTVSAASGVACVVITGWQGHEKKKGPRRSEAPRVEVFQGTPTRPTSYCYYPTGILLSRDPP